MNLGVCIYIYSRSMGFGCRYNYHVYRLLPLVFKENKSIIIRSFKTYNMLYYSIRAQNVCITREANCKSFTIFLFPTWAHTCFGFFYFILFFSLPVLPAAWGARSATLKNFLYNLLKVFLKYIISYIRTHITQKNKKNKIEF